MTKFETLINNKMKLYEAGLPSTYQNPMVKKPETTTPPNQAATTTTTPTQTPATPQNQTQTQTTPQNQQQTQTPNKYDPATFENMLKYIVQWSSDPDAQAKLKQYMSPQQPANGKPA